MLAQVPVRFDKITARINKLSYGLDLNYCDPVRGTDFHRHICCPGGMIWHRDLPTAHHCQAFPPTRPHLNVAQVMVSQKVAAGIYKGVTTSELDELAAETAAALTSSHPDYATVRWRRPLWAGAKGGSAAKGQCGSKGAAIPCLVTGHAPMTPAPPANTQLAARIAVSNLHKNTLKSFKET